MGSFRPILLLLVAVSVENVEAGSMGLFLDTGVNCPRNSKYFTTSYGCYAMSFEPVPWEFARDRCRDDGATLAVYGSWEEYKTIQINISYVLNQTKTAFAYVGLNQEGSFNGTISPETVPYAVKAKMYDDWWSLLGDSDPNRMLYRCGVMPYANWTAAGQTPTNLSSLKDPITGNLWPYQPSPYLFKCPKNGYDTYEQGMVCRLPGGPDTKTCICGKWKEPGVRNFKGDYITIYDQTEYIMVNTTSYVISILFWSGIPPSFPNLTYYFPDQGVRAEVVRIEYGGSLYQLSVSAYGCASRLSLSKDAQFCAYTAGSAQTTVGSLTVGTITANSTWQAIYVLMPDGTRIMLDSNRNVEIMTVNAVADADMNGLCGTCNINTVAGNALSNGRKTTRKTLLASSYIHQRVSFVSQPPTIETCASETHRRYAATRCKPLIDTLGQVFGPTLAAKSSNYSYGYDNYRRCMINVCSHGPAAACPFFKNFSDATNVIYTEATLQCASKKGCPGGTTFYETPSPDGMCYHVGSTEMYWDQAYRYCHSIGANLVSFMDGNDNDFIQCQIAIKLNIADPKKQYLWLGGIRDDQDQRHWTDGTSSTYSNWDTSGTEAADDRCATYQLANGQWIMKSCKKNVFRPFCYVYSLSDYTCSDLPCPPPKTCVDGACILAPQPFKACVRNPCINGGQCFTQGYYGSGYMCMCNKGYYGSRCQHTIDSVSALQYPELSSTQNNTLAALTIRRPVPNSCWLQGRIGDYLRVTDDPLPWELAREACRNYGGRLNSIDLDNDRIFFTTTTQWSAAYFRASVASKSYYMKDGADYNASIPAGCTNAYGGSSCPAGDGTNQCPTVTSNGGPAAPFQCPTSASSGQMPYVCKRPVGQCICSKSFEPVFRTFNGEDIPVMNGAYTLFSSAQFSVQVALHDPAALISQFQQGKFPYGKYYYPDKWPVVSRVTVVMANGSAANQIICELRIKIPNVGVNADRISANFDMEIDCPSNLPAKVSVNRVGFAQTNIRPLVPLAYNISAIESYGFELIYDGSNVELLVNYSIAASSKPGNGLCGSCDDQLRDTLFSSTQQIVENKRAVAQSFMRARDVQPWSRRRIPTCKTDTENEAADRLCYRLFKSFPAGTTEQDAFGNITSCLKYVCQYGPIGVCALPSSISGSFDYCSTQPGSCTTSGTTYATSNTDKLCQFTGTTPSGKTNFYDALVDCQSRAYNLSSVDPSVITVQNSDPYWVGAVAEVDHLIEFWLRGNDVSDAEHTSSSDVLKTTSPIPCLNTVDGSIWKNDLNCTSTTGVETCTATSGKCGGQTCLPPNVCISGTCTAPSARVIWPVY